MLSIKRSTINKAQLDKLPTYSLATQIVRRGSNKQKRELAQFLSEIAIVQLSASGIHYLEIPM